MEPAIREPLVVVEASGSNTTTTRSTAWKLLQEGKARRDARAQVAAVVAHGARYLFPPRRLKPLLLEASRDEGLWPQLKSRAIEAAPALSNATMRRRVFLLAIREPGQKGEEPRGTFSAELGVGAVNHL